MRQKTAAPQAAVPGETVPAARIESRISYPASRIPHLVPHVAVLLAYLAATIVFTWPLASGLADHSIERGDTWQAMWNFWLLKHNLLDLHIWPLDTNLVYYPSGASLYQHTFDLDMGLLFLPLTILLGPILSFNLASLFVCVATGYTMFLLARYLSGNSIAGFVAGFALTFCAWHISRLGGQMNLASLQWVPLYMLFIVRREGRLWVNALGAGIALALTIMAGWYLALYLGVFTALWLLDRWLDRKATRQDKLVWTGRTVAANAAALLITSPLILGLIGGASSRTFSVPPFAESVTWSADLLAYFLPTTYSTFFGGLLHALDINFWGSIEWEKMVFPGWSILILAGYALRQRLAPSRVWFNLALVCGLLSFGPALHFAGQLVMIAGVGLPMPYLAFYQLPGVEVSRTPVRFALMVLIALCVLAAYGLANALRRAKRPLLIGGGLALLIAVEQLIVPLPFEPITISPFYHTLAQEQGDFAILEVPVGALGDYQLYQTIHQKPIVGGYLSRSPIDPFIEGSPGVREFTYLSSNTLLQQPAGLSGLSPVASAARALLQEEKIRYILLHKPMLADRLADLSALAQEISGAGPVFEDDELRAYRVSGAPDPAQVILQLGRGWKQDQEIPFTTLQTPLDTSAAVHGWADQGAEVLVTAFKPQRVQLTLDAAGFDGARNVALLREGRPIASWQLGDQASRVTTPPFFVPAGVTHLTLTSDTPATPLPKPSTFDKSRDSAIIQATRVGLDVLPAQ